MACHGTGSAAVGLLSLDVPPPPPGALSCSLGGFGAPAALCNRQLPLDAQLSALGACPA